MPLVRLRVSAFHARQTVRESERAREKHNECGHAQLFYYEMMSDAVTFLIYFLYIYEKRSAKKVDDENVLAAAVCVINMLNALRGETNLSKS